MRFVRFTPRARFRRFLCVLAVLPNQPTALEHFESVKGSVRIAVDFPIGDGSETYDEAQELA